MKIRTLIVDDEPLGRLNLSTLLAQEPDFELVGEAADASSALAAMARTRPDLVFLDIEMPGMSGLDVRARSRVDPEPAWVFVTAHDQYAVRAFDAEALDYLLKPFRRDRFDATLQRVRQRRRGAGRPGPVADAGRPAVLPERLVVKDGNRLVFVACDEIEFIQAAGNCVTIHVGGQVHTARESLGDLEARLPEGRFVRIHRSYLVPWAGLNALFPVGPGEYMAALRSGRELPVGASYLPAIRRVLEVIAPRPRGC